MLTLEYCEDEELKSALAEELFPGEKVGSAVVLRADGVPLRADIMTVEEMAVELCRSKFGA